MSIESWKEEFLNKGDLQEWVGFRDENLKKHDLEKVNKFRWISDSSNNIVYRVDIIEFDDYEYIKYIEKRPEGGN